MFVHLGALSGAPGGNRGLKEARAQRVEFGGCPFDVPARLQPAHHGDVKDVAPYAVRWHTKRKRDVEAVSHDHAEKFRWRYADDFDRGIIDHQLDPFGRIPPAKFSLPIGITRHADAHGTSPFVFRQQQAPAEGLNSKHLKKIAAHPKSVKAAHFAAAPNIPFCKAPCEDA